MIALKIALGIFALLETLNVILLYKKPDFDQGNTVGVFRAYAKSQEDPEIAPFVNYLINWVAGTKLIFIVLIIGIIITGGEAETVFSIIALIFSIATFFSRLYPRLAKMDADGQLSEKGYSRTLAIMIGSFIAVFVIALVIFMILR
jgi:hypothetical protein